MEKGEKGKAKVEPHGMVRTNGKTNGTHPKQVPPPSTPTGLHQQKGKVKGNESTRQHSDVTFIRNTGTAQTGASITHIELGDHKNSNGATTTKRTVIPPRNAAKAMVRRHLNNNMARAKARRDLVANERKEN